MTEVPQNLHRDIMRSVKIVKTRYYLYGIFTGFIVGLLTTSYIVYEKMIEQGSVDFLSTWFESIRIDMVELFNFNDEIIEFFPWGDLSILFLVVLAVIVLLSIIIRFRKVLFLKVEKFSSTKRVYK